MSKKQTREMLNQMMMAFVSNGGKIQKLDKQTLRKKRSTFPVSSKPETVDMSAIPTELKAKLGLK